MSDVVFDYPYLLVLAAVLPLLAVLVLRHAYRQRRARLARLGSMEIVARLIPPNTLVSPGWRMARLGLASALVGIAVAGPAAQPIEPASFRHSSDPQRCDAQPALWEQADRGAGAVARSPRSPA